ncbi:uncharacterized protein KY384_008680 [Bacidia gigantensis]|uniref:uncharacterized protein n=1 Tax=Bacidia gigantensis TaxID=2732470 RepID=UPI001D04E354|nr:uncharacterized protein KY384_008680 [Bacidia gigantensis]KAG8526480.1 hypothetical protein KY384_008680 [Bacidia gigantensis]
MPDSRDSKPKAKKRGFVVVQKIEKDLIRSAKIKKSYAKLKERENAKENAASTGIHPDRKAMLAEGEGEKQRFETLQQTKRTRPKPEPFQKEFSEANIRKETRERRREEIDRRLQEREVKRAEHEKFRRAVQKARQPGRNGQRRLGRECKLLPQMVENLMGKLQNQGK